jgi:uncharacterized hydrophobic protein (TIGR00271 family)
MTEVAASLDALPGSRHVIRTDDSGSGAALVTADLGDGTADAALEAVRRLGVPAEDVELLRLDSVGPTSSQRGGVVWADLLGQAGTNARPLARYLVFMAVAGVIAGFGVIYRNGILIVGAMAVSPDILPITATCTALVLRRFGLARRALTTLLIGLGVACVVAGTMTFVLDHLDLLPSDFEVGSGGLLTGLSSVNASTVLVALAAGIAGILSLETRATFAVGVAISVTTIPASAYLGVAAGVGQAHKAEGALLVLAVNIAMLMVGGSLTLLIQRRVARSAA